MSLTVSTDLLKSTIDEGLATYREKADISRVDREIDVETSRLTDAGLADIIRAAGIVGDKKTLRAAESILNARSGHFDRPVPNFKAFKGVLEAFLKADMTDGWIYVNGEDGRMYPQLITAITHDDGFTYGRKGSPMVRIHTASYGFNREGQYRNGMAIHHDSHVFVGQDVANKRISAILADAGIFKETAALKASYLESLERHRTVTQNGFSKQFRVNGPVYYFEANNHLRRGEALVARRVIHDLAPKDCGPVVNHIESSIFESNDAKAGVGEVPEHPLIRVFDLRTHEFLWVHADHLEPHKYDKSLGSKLVLPASHRDLLNVMTNDLGAFVSDFVEGKSAGNVILCKGIPGVGKTLTAEVYAELIERPLYSIHSGSLGTSANEIEKSLREIFQRSKRWDCALLLDEADVFVAKRGKSIEQNAIVAEFLRTLEYFDGLLFMTTNRPDDIDEAIINRCAAIVDYQAPAPEDAATVWMVMSEQNNAGLTPDLIEQLVALFPEIAPRDIKMLLRLALRMSLAHKEPLTLETFRRCAMFRAIKMRA